MKVYVKNHGCAANKAYSEMLRGISNTVDNIKDADKIVINTCALKTPSEYKLSREIKEIEKKYPKKKIEIFGCLPKALPESKLKKYYASNEIDSTKIKLNFPRKKYNNLIGIVPVSEGCLGNCSFCMGKLAKGNLFSYPIKNILKEIKKQTNEGCNEIYLTSQDMGCYGFDRNTNLISLLRKVIEIPGDFLIRVGMMNPNYALEFLDELISIYKNKKMYKFIHIPVQSGSDRILKSMNRAYQVEDFEKVVKSLRKHIPNITISTDIIVGFPGETEEDFEKTYELIKKTKPEVLNLTRYWPRKGTEAAKFPNQIHSKFRKKRSRKLSKLFNKIYLETNKKWLNKDTNVLINSKGTKKNQYKGRNIYYKPIVLDSKKNILGKTVIAKIIKINDRCLTAEIN